MTRRSLMLASVLSLLAVGLSMMIWRDEALRPRYQTVPIEWLGRAEFASSLVGKRLIVEGDAGPSLGRHGRDYALFYHYKEDHPWSPASLFVRPRSTLLPHDTDHVTLYGVLQASPDGLLLIEEGPPPPPLWVSLLSGAVVAVPVTAGIGVLVLAVRAVLKHRVRTRRVYGFCAKCGYDLRASKDRCPECGTPIMPREWTPA